MPKSIKAKQGSTCFYTRCFFKRNKKETDTLNITPVSSLYIGKKNRRPMTLKLNQLPTKIEQTNR